MAAADVICCCTTAREPLFDGALVADHACVVAIGSHEPAARETDDRLAARATVVVESRTSALREAGDVIGAIEAGAQRRTSWSRCASSSPAPSLAARPAPVQEHRHGLGGRGRRGGDAGNYRGLRATPPRSRWTRLLTTGGSSSRRP